MPFAEAAADEPWPERLDRLLASLAAHRAAQPLGFADREARCRHGDVEHLVLEDDDTERVAQSLAERLVQDRRLEGGIGAFRMPVLHVGVNRLALDRARAHERDLDGQIVEVLGARLQEALHLGAALDLEDADRVGALDLLVDTGVVERHTREVDRLAAQARDAVDRVLDRREHAEPEQVDLEEAGVAAAVLVPLADLPSRHRRGLHRHEVDQRPGRDDHAARVLADVARQSCDLLRQLAKRGPARTGMPAGHPVELVADAGCVPAVGDAGEPLELGERQAERLSHVANRTAAAVGRERRDEGCVLTSVALGDAHDQLLADVAGEVEVDVGHGDHLVVDEPAEGQAGRDGIDVREAGQVTDDRADAGATPAPRRQCMARAPGPANLERALARQLEHLPVEEEEPGEPESRDQGKLVVETTRAHVSCGRSHSRTARRRLGRRSAAAAGRPDRRPSEKSG